ncbi:MAG TPA: NF038129 family PEP-CTERM protein [Opitutaceae bacterium]|nr:NF038129 family PEP-CTERM protein [Opitutaceae bacterium]
MKSSIRSHFLAVAFTGLAGFLLSSSATFGQLFRVNIATTPLTLPANSASAPFSLDFQLNSGSTLNNNTALLSNFTFSGGGAPFGVANTFGGAGGSLPGAITLSDTLAFNEFFQSFTPGSILSFDLHLSQNVDAGPTPDGFSVSLLDGSLFNLPTTGFADQLLTINILGANPSIQTFAGTGSYAGVSLSIVAIPEPSTYGLIAASVLLVGIVVRRRRVAKISTV